MININEMTIDELKRELEQTEKSQDYIIAEMIETRNDDIGHYLQQFTDYEKKLRNRLFALEVSHA